MRYTSEIFQRLSKGQFISSNSLDADTRTIYNDVEENFDAYRDYFQKIDFILSAGDGYYYFSRKEPKVSTENKLQSLFSWIDILDFLKTYESTFSAGTQFKLSQMENRVAADMELKDKIIHLFDNQKSIRDKLEALVDEMQDKGFAECVNEMEESYQVTSAFNYIEQIILCITINEEIKDEIPE
ncbi:MAG: hypothetical protein HUK16_01615 [Bacteroidales bacterium]|nr:hypothetical protein [Bacteroidales bacterium]